VLLVSFDFFLGVQRGRKSADTEPLHEACPTSSEEWSRLELQRLLVFLLGVLAVLCPCKRLCALVSYPGLVVVVVVFVKVRAADPHANSNFLICLADLSCRTAFRRDCLRVIGVLAVDGLEVAHLIFFGRGKPIEGDLCGLLFDQQLRLRVFRGRTYLIVCINLSFESMALLR